MMSGRVCTPYFVLWFWLFTSSHIRCVEKDTPDEYINKNIKLCTLNAKSVCNKAEDIAELIKDQNADICAITETWLTPGRHDHITLDNLIPLSYKVDHVPRKSGKRGRVALVYKDSLSFDILKAAAFTSSTPLKHLYPLVMIVSGLFQSTTLQHLANTASQLMSSWKNLFST